MSRVGEYAVVSRNISRGSNDLYVIPLEDRHETPLTTTSGPAVSLS
jgi:hypothetical protein